MPTRLRDLVDNDFGALDQQKNRNIIRYNASTKKFDLVEIDSTLGLTTDPPELLVNTIENNVDISKLNLDGGNF